MVRAWLPIGVTVALLVGLSAAEWIVGDVFRGSGISPEVIAQRFKDVPIEVPGTSWVGEDKPVADDILRVAGAVNHINRTYVNGDTGEKVDVWLICGHCRDVIRHTPNVCYISQGFRQIAPQIHHIIDPPGDGPYEQPGEFYTAKFTMEEGGAHQVRVFWTWNGNDKERGQTKWESPNPNPRRHFGNNTALYKLYFTANVSSEEDRADQSVAVAFAKLMLPEINKALFPNEAGLALPADEKGSAESAPPAEEKAAAPDAPAEEASVK